MDNGKHLRSSVEINCSTGTLVRPANLSYYTPFTEAGKSVNVDINGYAACCVSPSHCTILENKEKLAAQLLEIALTYNLSGFSMVRMCNVLNCFLHEVID